MDKIYYDDHPGLEYVDISEKSSIIEKPKKNRRFKSTRYVIPLGTLISIIVISCWVAFSHLEIFKVKPDPERLAPSSAPMGLYSKVGVVSNGGPCAKIGVNVLSKGGNAVDAAIATLLCDGVLCPEYMGLGGGFIMSIYNTTTKKVMSINARETAPSAATSTMFVGNPKQSVYGGLAIGVPGELKGYSAIYELYGGGVSWESLFQPTIQLCEDGIEISKRLEINLGLSEDLIKNDTHLRNLFFDEKTRSLKKAGDLYKLPLLAKTLKIIAKEGVDAFYNGSLTSKLLEDLKKINSTITKDDLVNYKVEIDETFPVNLKSGYTIHVGPPPSSGIMLAYILRILDGILPAPDAGLDAQRLVEAFKFGFGERSRLGDHKFVNVSEIYEKVKSDDYINSIQSKISDNFTSQNPKFYGADYDISQNHGTANMAVIDSKGNTVVATSTLNTFFGCGVVSPSTGIILNNQMDDFSTPGFVNYYGIPSSPANFIEPGKRPMSSMSPTIFTDKNGDFVLGVGAAGGSKITISTAYVAALKLWFKKTLKEAIDKPRVFHQLVPMLVEYENGITKGVLQKLKDIGHSVTLLKKGGSAASAIAKTSTGMLEAMADFRRQGTTFGY